MTPRPSSTIYAGSTRSQLVRISLYRGKLIGSIQSSSFSRGKKSSSLSRTSSASPIGLFACSYWSRITSSASQTSSTGTPYVCSVYSRKRCGNWSVFRPPNPQLLTVTVAPSALSASTTCSLVSGVSSPCAATCIQGAFGTSEAAAAPPLIASERCSSVRRVKRVTDVSTISLLSGVNLGPTSDSASRLFLVPYLLPSASGRTSSTRGKRPPNSSRSRRSSATNRL